MGELELKKKKKEKSSCLWRTDIATGETTNTYEPELQNMVSLVPGERRVHVWWTHQKEKSPEAHQLKLARSVMDTENHTPPGPVKPKWLDYPWVYPKFLNTLSNSNL